VKPELILLEGPEEAALYEQLALRRLRQLAWRHRRRRAVAAVGRAGAQLEAILWNVFGGADLVQEVAPGVPPLRRWQWERPEWRQRPGLI